MNAEPSLTIQDRLSLLSRVGMFRELSADELRLLVETAEVRRVGRGSVLFSEGDPGNEAFVVASGELHGTIGGAVRAVLQEGDLFGEYALFTGHRRTLEVSAASNCVLLVLSHDRLEALLELKPVIAISLLRQTVLRLVALERQTHQQSPP